LQKIESGMMVAERNLMGVQKVTTVLLSKNMEWASKECKKKVPHERVGSNPT